jgi:hypothetical protein
VVVKEVFGRGLGRKDRLAWDRGVGHDDDFSGGEDAAQQAYAADAIAYALASIDETEEAILDAVVALMDADEAP